ncbi:MAG TPA: hypothetical protein VHU87_07540 [Rhizomicrobium sp.]|nr:hypothetical protein [Rhizomicrobium sp.]
MTDFLFRARIVLLSILMLLALGTSAACVRLGIHPEAPLQLGAAFLILAAAAFLLVRHIGLAAVALLAPLAGWPVALLLAAVFVPDVPYLIVQAFGFLPGFFAAAVLAACMASRIADGHTPDTAARGAARDLTFPLLCALAPALCTPMFVAGSFALTELIAVGVCGVFALLAVPLAVSLLPFGEDFVARFNRIHERRVRSAAWLAPIAEPRWAWSLSGVAVVLLALGYFGTVPHTIAWSGRVALAWGIAAVVLLAVAAVAMRDWRRVLATVLCYPPLVFLSLWPIRLVWTNPDASLGALQILGFGATLVFAASAFAASLAREDRGTASARTLEQQGATIAAVTLATALAAAVLMPTALPLALVVLIWGAGALVFPPAFNTALESLFPTREAIAARYKVG